MIPFHIICARIKICNFTVLNYNSMKLIKTLYRLHESNPLKLYLEFKGFALETMYMLYIIHCSFDLAVGISCWVFGRLLNVKCMLWKVEPRLFAGKYFSRKQFSEINLFWFVMFMIVVVRKCFIEFMDLEQEKLIYPQS